MGVGKDPTNLGRWCWGRYQGKHGVVLRVVSIYRPCDNPGSESVSTQQRSYFQKRNNDRHPRDAFMEDFRAELKEWYDMGHQIIVGGDINDEVTSNSIEEVFQEFDMRHVIFERHDRATSPATFSRNKSGKVIDGVWATSTIHPI